MLAREDEAYRIIRPNLLHHVPCLLGSPMHLIKSASARPAHSLLFSLIFLSFGLWDCSAVPQLISFQGRVQVDGADFNGSGEFRFALVNEAGSTTYWSNDGTSNAGSHPTDAVSLTVTNGLYSVLLGNATLPNMTVVPASVFTNDDVFLRIWFDDGTNGSQLLGPDQRIAAVGYAMMAANAASAETVPDGAITSLKLADDAVTAAKLQAGAVEESKVAAGAITTTKLAPDLDVPSILQSGTHTVPGVFESGEVQFEVTFPVPFNRVPEMMFRNRFSNYRVTEVTATGFTGTTFMTGPDATVDPNIDLTSIRAGSSKAMLILDGRPAVAYLAGLDLRLAINANTSGTGVWNPTNVASLAPNGTHYLGQSLAVINGKPSLSFRALSQQNLSQLKFAVSEAADGSGTWTTNLVFDGHSNPSSLAEVAGKPMIAFSSFQFPRRRTTMYLATNDEADGTGTWTTSVVRSDTPWRPSLAEVNGRPALAYRGPSGPTGPSPDIIFSVNSQPDGSGTWTETVVGQGAAPFLSKVDGRPAMIYSDTDLNRPVGSLHFAINANADGSGPWTTSTVGTTYHDGAPNAPLYSLATIGGMPGVCYYDQDHGRIAIAINTTADGSGVWNPTLIPPTEILVDRTAAYSLADLGGNPVICSSGYFWPRVGEAIPPGPDKEIRWVALKP